MSLGLGSVILMSHGPFSMPCLLCACGYRCELSASYSCHHAYPLLRHLPAMMGSNPSGTISQINSSEGCSCSCSSFTPSPPQLPRSVKKQPSCWPHQLHSRTGHTAAIARLPGFSLPLPPLPCMPPSGPLKWAGLPAHPGCLPTPLICHLKKNQLSPYNFPPETQQFLMQV